MNPKDSMTRAGDAAGQAASGGLDATREAKTSSVDLEVCERSL